MADRQIRYGIGFDVDITTLDQLKLKLNDLANITQKDLKLINPKATATEIKEMQAQVKTAAQEMQNALNAAYNPKLNTLNINTFNQAISQGTMSIKQMDAALTNAGVEGKNAFIDMTKGLFTTQREVKKTSKFLDSLGSTFINTVKWSLASSAIQMFTRSVSNAFSYVVNLDKSLNDIRIVTDKSSKSMETFAQNATKAAKELGSSTKAYTDAALIYYQQGLGEEDVKARTDVTIKAANVTGQSAAEVSEQLTAVWNGYKVVAEDAERYIDKLAAVAASTAADLEELSEGMSKVASGANAMGVNIDQLTAQLSTIVSVTRQDASVVGTALKTIYARMGDLQVDGIDEFGVSLGDVSGKLQQVGIQVLDQQGNLRDMGTVMEEVAGKWGTWTQAQQQAIAVAMAGKRQYNNLLALFENWDMYESALNTSKNADGTLEKQQQTKLDSFEAKLNKLKATGEDVYNSLFDSDSMKGFLDVVTGLVEGINQFVKGVGGGGTLLLSLGSTAAAVFSNQIAGGIANVISNFKLQRDVVAQNRAEIEIMSKYQEAQSSTVAKLVNLYATGVKYGDLMNDEEKKELDFLIEQTAELEKQKNIEQEKIKSSKEFYNKEHNGRGQLAIAGQTESGRNIIADQYITKADDLDKAAKIQNQYVDYESIRDQQIEQMRALGFEKEDTANVFTDYQDKNSAWAQTAKDVYATNISTAKADGASQEEIALLEKKQALINEILKSQNEYSEAAEKTSSAIQNLIKNEHVDIDTKNKLKSLLKEDGSLKVSLTSATAVLKTETKKLSTEYRNQAEQVKKGSSALDSLKIQMSKVKAATKQLFSTLDTKAAVKGVTQLMSGIGQLGSAIMSISNLGDVLKDDTLTPLEKFAQVASSVGMAASMITMTMSQLGGAFKSFGLALGMQNTLWGVNKAMMAASTEADRQKILTNFLLTNSEKLLGKEIDEATASELINNAIQENGININKKGAAGDIIRAITQKKSGDAALEAGKKGFTGGTLMKEGWLGAMGPVGWIIAAITAVIALVVGLILIFGDFTDKSHEFEEQAKKDLQAIQEQTRRFSEELNKAKEKYNELINDIEDYRDAADALTKLREGTREWKESVAELNMQVLDLINKYPILMSYITNSNGVLGIKQEGFDALIENQKNIINDATMKNIVAQATLFEGKTNVEQGKIKDLVKQYDEYDTKSFFTEQAKKELGITKNTTTHTKGQNSTTVTKYYFENGKEHNEEGTSAEKVLTDRIDELLKESKFGDKEASEYFASDGFIEDLSKAIGTDGNENLLTDSEAMYNFIAEKIYGSNAELIGKQSETGIYLQQVADSLTQNSGILQSNIEALTAQKEASMALNKTYLKMLGEETDVADVEAFTNIGANLFDEETLDYGKYKDEYKYIDMGGAITGGEKVDTVQDRNAISAEVQKWVKEAYGDVSYSGLTSDDFKDITRQADFEQMIFKVDKNGDGIIEEEVTGAQLIADASAARVKKEAKETTEKTSEIINNLAEQGADTQLAYAIAVDQGLVNANQILSTWDEMTLADIQKMSNLSDTDITALNKLGYSLNEDAIKQWTDSMGIAINETQSAISNKLGYNEKNEKNISTLSQSDFSNFTRSQLQDLENTFENIYTAAGSAGTVFLDSILAAAENPTAVLKISELAKNVNWSDISSVALFRESISGIVTETQIANAGWNDFMDNAFKGIRIWTKDISSIETVLNDISSLTKDISLNDVIDDETYKKLIGLAPSLSKYFIQTADGWKALASGITLQNEALDFYKVDFGALKDNYTKGNKFVASVGNDYKSLESGSSASDIKNYFKNTLGGVAAASGVALNDFYSSLGLNADTINEKLSIIGNKNADTSDPEYQSALKYLEEIGFIIDDRIGQEQLDWEAAEALFADTFIKNWRDLEVTTDANGNKIYKYDGELLSTKTGSRLETQFRNEAIKSLGIENEKYLEHLTTDELIDHVETVRKMEIDFLGIMQTKIEKLGKEVDNAFGAKKIAKLQELSALQDNYLKEAIKFSNGAQTVVSNLQNDKLTLDAIAEAKGGSWEVKENEDGTFSLQEKDEQGNFKAIDLGSLTAEDIRALMETEGIDEATKAILEQYANMIDSQAKAAQNVLTAQYEYIDSKLSVFETTLQIKLDLQEAIREWEEFEAKYINRTGMSLLEDFSGWESYNLANKNYESYKTDYDTNVDTLKGLDSDPNDEKFTPIFDGAEDTAIFWDTFNNALEGAQAAIESMVDQAKEMLDSYDSIHEEIVSLYDDQTERISNINDLYSTSIDLFTLLNKNTGKYSDKINEFLQESSKNAVTANELAMEQLKAAQLAYNNDYEKASKEQRKMLEENLTAASEKVLETSQSLLDAINAQFQESLTQAIETAFGNSTLSQISEEWQRDLYFDERYLDETNKAYSLSNLENRIQKSIDETDSYSAQKKLNKLKEQELAILRSRDKLTQADLDRANARYELTLKQIALEEAQQTANKMKLTRDASGNYSYQYVADQDEISKRQEEFNKAENDLYNLNKSQEKELINLITSKYQEAVSSISGASTAEEKEALNNYYFGPEGVITLLENDLNRISEEGGQTDTYTSPYKATIDKLLSASPTNIKDEIDNLINSENGFKTSMENINNNLNQLFGTDGSLTTAIESLTSTLEEKDNGLYFKEVFGYTDKKGNEVQGSIEKASGILTELTEEGGILATINNYAKGLQKYGEYKLKQYSSSDSLNKNTTALNSLTAAILMQADLMNDSTIDGDITTPSGWKFEEGVYVQDAETN